MRLNGLRRFVEKLSPPWIKLSAKYKQSLVSFATITGSQTSNGAASSRRRQLGGGKPIKLSGRHKVGLDRGARATKKTSKGSTPAVDTDAPKISGAVKAQHMREDLGAIVSAIVNLPRYRHLPIGQVADMFIAPLQSGRISVARVSRDKDAANTAAVAGFVVWASVSESVSTKISEQIKAGVFPIHLSSAEWTSGDDIWLLDVVASNRKVATAVLAGVIRSIESKKARLHPIIQKLVEANVDDDRGGPDVGTIVGRQEDIL